MDTINLTLEEYVLAFVLASSLGLYIIGFIVGRAWLRKMEDGSNQKD